jgi:O-antigen/teichoic acid export membrane protein
MNPAWTRFLPGIIRRKIEGSQALQKVLGNTGWMMGDQVLRKGVSLLVGVLMARYLGPRVYGEFSYAIAMVVIVSPIAILSLDATAIRRLVRSPADKDEILGTSLILMLAGGFLAFGLAMAAVFLARPEDRLMHWLIGILAAGNITRALIAIEFWFESQMEWQFSVYAKTSVFLLLALVKIGLILVQAPLIAFAWAALAETTLSSVGLLLVYWRRGYVIRAWRFTRTMASSLLKDSWPLVFSALLTMVYLRIDQIMLGNMVGNEELGNYSVAVQLSEVWYFLPMVISSSIFPAIIEAEVVSEELFLAHMQRLYRLMVFIAYAIALPVAYFAPQIVKLLFSSAFAAAGPLAALLVWAGVFTGLGAARNVLIIAKNWTRVNLVTIFLGGALNILLNFWLIPKYGAMGAVVATIISYWFAIHGTCFMFKQLRQAGWMMTRAMLYPKFW